MTNKITSVFISSISFLLGIIFITAGIEKLTGLPDIIGPHYLIEELEKHGLELYGKFIAYSQIIIGFLLINNRFRLLGAILLFPLLLNILFIVTSLDWNGTPYIVAFLLFLNCILILKDFHKIKFVFSNNDLNELKRIKIRRTKVKLDIYFCCLLIIILIGGSLGWTQYGKILTKTGMLSILLSILILNIYRAIKNKKQS